MKTGLYYEGNELVYYKDDELFHAGVIKVDEKIYYIDRYGKAVRGEHIVHSKKSNNILERGTYTFGEDYTLIEGSYKPPKKKRKHKKKKKWYKSLAKSDKKLLRVAMPVFVVFLAISIFAIVDGIVENVREPQQEMVANEVPESHRVVLPAYDEEVLLCSQEAKDVYDGRIAFDDAVKAGNPYDGFEFEYTITSDEGGELYISEKQDMTDAKTFKLSKNESAVTIDNLKTGTKYYYKVIVDNKSYFGGFKTAASTRFIYVPGIYNTRDIGGYTTLDGKTVKQGMIIRGTEIDGLVEPGYYLKDDDLEYFKSEFKFKSDFDLRQDMLFVGDFEPRMGANVDHNFYTAPAYSQIFHVNYMSSLHEIFTDLADKDNYPIYLHCTYGADRTGTIVFLLQGLLNMSEEEIITEYRRTAYFDGTFATNNNMEPVLNGLEMYGGDTVNEQIVSFLINDVGISCAQIDSIRNILLED